MCARGLCSCVGVWAHALWHSARACDGLRSHRICVFFLFWVGEVRPRRSAAWRGGRGAQAWGLYDCMTKLVAYMLARPSGLVLWGGSSSSPRQFHVSSPNERQAGSHAQRAFWVRHGGRDNPRHLTTPPLFFYKTRFGAQGVVCSVS